MINDFKNVMLISPKKVKEYGNINLNVDDGEIGAAIRISQSIYLREVVGQDLIEHIQQLIYNKVKGNPDNIDDPENEPYKVLLEDYLTPALVYRTAVELCQILTLKIRNMGLVKNNDTNVETTSASELSHMKEYYDTFVNDAYNRIADFLCENKKAYVEVDDNYCTCSEKPKYGRTGLWLG